MLFVFVDARMEDESKGIMRVILSLKILLISLLATPIIYGQAWKDSLRYGQSLYANGDYQGAYQAFISAQKMALEDVNLSQDIANAAYRLKDYEMARKAYQSALTESGERMITSKYWHNIGNTQFQEKDYQNAIESYKNALRLDAQNEASRYNLAMAQRLLKQEQQKQQQKQNSSQNNLENQQPQQQEEINNADSSSPSSPKEEKNKDMEGKLAGQRSDKVLDQLLKEEMATQEKLRKMEEREGGMTNSGKQW